MSLLSEPRRRQAEALARLFRQNPFRPERAVTESHALGASYVAPSATWSGDEAGGNPNQRALEALATSLLAEMKTALESGTRLTLEDRALYAEVGLVVLYDTFAERLDSLVHGAAEKVLFYEDFQAAFQTCFFDERTRPKEDVAHVFALLFQLRRAFFHVFRFLLGSSAPAAQLRADVWDSIFTHDIARYRRSLYTRLGEVSTLVTGPSGTGKELVARAVGLSRYVPFQTRTRSFRWNPERAFLPLNLSALTPTLVESELFGHKKGAFTGAVEDREGWLAACPAFGAVFLDEIGEIAPALQVKLLRVLESRTFSPMGSTEVIPFRGKILAATNRDLGAMIDDGRFREDLYFRLCSNRIETPRLLDRVADDPSEIERLVRFFAGQIAGEDEAESVASEALVALASLPRDYPWPGNIRELSQAVRQILVRGAYSPPTLSSASSSSWLAAKAGTLTSEEVSAAYTRHVYARVGTYDGTAKVLGIDRRTVRARVTSGVPPE